MNSYYFPSPLSLFFPSWQWSAALALTASLSLLHTQWNTETCLWTNTVQSKWCLGTWRNTKIWLYINITTHTLTHTHTFSDSLVWFWDDVFVCLTECYHYHRPQCVLWGQAILSHCNLAGSLQLSAQYTHTHVRAYAHVCVYSISLIPITSPSHRLSFQRKPTPTEAAEWLEKGIVNCDNTSDKLYLDIYVS